MRNEPKQFIKVPQSETTEASNIRQGMTDEELMEAWAETGDEKYLTPATMAKMGMARGEDDEIIFANTSSDQDLDSEILRRWGVDVKKLQTASAKEISAALLPLASRNVSFERRSRVQNYSEDDRDAARRELSRFIREQPEQMMRALFSELDPEKTESLEYLRHLEDEIRLTARFSQTLAENGNTDNPLYGDFTAILMSSIKEAETSKQRLWNDQHGRYLVFQAIQDFCSRILLSRGGPEDSDLYVPFEISKGTYAAFSLDNNRIFVASESDSEQIAELFRFGWTQEYKEHGHDAPTYKLEHFDEGLLELWEQVIDNGTLISELFPMEFSKDPVLIHHYALLLHSRFRAIIEEDLQLRLRDLSIKEQLYFLDHAKRVAWHRRDELRDFISQWKIPGLRTFLAVSADPKVGDEILALGRDAEPEKVRAIFTRFAEFADRIGSVEEYLTERFGRADVDMVHESGQRLLARGRSLLGEAHTHKDNPEELERLIASLDTETRIFGDLARLYIDRGYALKDIVGVDVRSITGGALKGDLRRELTKMHREGYEKSGEYSRQQIKNLEHGLEKKFDDASSEFKVVIETGKDKPLAALRFDLKKDEKGDVASVYLASVMSDGNLEGSRIGLLNVETQIKAQLDAHDAPITAIANPRAPITSKYLEMGFVVTGVTQSSDGKPFFELEMRKDRLASFKTVGGRATESAIKSAQKSGAISPDASVIRVPPSSLEEILEKFESLKAENADWCMTRYFKDSSSKDQPRYFAVFERATS